MAENNPSVKVVRRRRRIPLGDKMDIVRRYESGQSVTFLSRSLGMSKSTIVTILKDKERIREHVRDSGPVKSTVITMQRSPIVYEMETLLESWIVEQIRMDLPLNVAVIQQEAKRLFEELKIKRCETEASFNASRGWFNRFKHRANLKALLEAGNASHLVDPSQDTDSNAPFLGGQLPIKLPRKQEPHTSKDEYYTGCSDAGPAFDPPVQHEDDSHSTFVDYVFQATAQKELQITKTTPVRLESTDRSSSSRCENEPKPGTSSQQHSPIKIVCAPDLRRVKSQQAMATSKDAIQILPAAPPPQPPPPPPPKLIPATRLISKSVSITYKPKEPPSSSSTSTSSNNSSSSRIPIVYFGDESEQQSTANIEKVLMQLRAEKLMLEMDKLKAEREKMGVEVRNITLRRKILILRKELFQSGYHGDDTMPSNGWEEDISLPPRALSRISVIKPDKLSIAHVESLKMNSVTVTPIQIPEQELLPPVSIAEVKTSGDSEILPTEVPSQSLAGPLHRTEDPSHCPKIPSQDSEVPSHCPEVTSHCPAVPLHCPEEVPSHGPEIPSRCPEVPSDDPEDPSLCPEVPFHGSEAPSHCPEIPSHSSNAAPLHSSENPSCNTVEISKQTESSATESSVADSAKNKNTEINQKSSPVITKTARKRRVSERGESASNSSFLHPSVGSDDETQVKVEAEDPEKLEKVGIFYESSGEGLDIEKRLHPSGFDEGCSAVENNASGETSGGSGILETRLLGSSDRQWNPSESSGDGCIPGIDSGGYQELSFKRLEFESSSTPHRNVSDQNEDIVAKRKRIEDEFGLHMDMN